MKQTNSQSVEERKNTCPCITQHYMGRKGLDKQLTNKFGKKERKPPKKTIKQLFKINSKYK